MLFTRDIVVTANTLESAPNEKILKIAHGIITWISVLEPPGCHGMVHCVILHHEHQIAPSTENMSMIGDAVPIQWDEYYESYQPPYELKIKLWSPGTSYSHKVTIRVAIMPRKAVVSSGIIDTIKGFFGLVSPTRVYTAPPEPEPPEPAPPEPEPPEPAPPEPAPPPPPPICTIGETKCTGYDLYECKTVAGKADWVLREKNSAYCGYTPPPPPPLPKAKFTYVSGIRSMGMIYPKLPWGGEYFRLQVDVKNIGAGAGTCTITAWFKSLIVGVWASWFPLDNEEYGVRSVELEPGKVGTLEWWVVNVMQASQEETKVTCEAGTLEARVK